MYTYVHLYFHHIFQRRHHPVKLRANIYISMCVLVYLYINHHLYIATHIYVYLNTHIYVYVCVCVCASYIVKIGLNSFQWHYYSDVR